MDSNYSFVLTVVVAATMGAVLGWYIGGWKGRDKGAWALLGFLLPISILILIFLPKLQPKSTTEPQQSVRQQADTRECPHCAETILVKAKVCKHCGRDVI
jgi:uncharacterized membrane protein YfcA